MRKRLLSLFLAMIMSMALMPISAFADELDQPEADSDSITNVEALQTRINALPTAEVLEIMEADEQETAYAEVSAIYDALEELSEEELAEIDQTTLEAAAAFFNQQIMPLEEPEEPVVKKAIYVSDVSEKGKKVMMRPVTALVKKPMQAWRKRRKLSMRTKVETISSM